MIFSLAYDDAAFEAVATRFVAAAQAMRADGWWEGEVPSDRAIRRSILREVAAVRLGGSGTAWVCARRIKPDWGAGRAGPAPGIESQAPRSCGSCSSTSSPCSRASGALW